VELRAQPCRVVTVCTVRRKLGGDCRSTRMQGSPSGHVKPGKRQRQNAAASYRRSSQIMVRSNTMMTVATCEVATLAPQIYGNRRKGPQTAQDGAANTPGQKPGRSKGA
jgi:hypothetical protein